MFIPDAAPIFGVVAIRTNVEVDAMVIVFFRVIRGAPLESGNHEANAVTLETRSFLFSCSIFFVCLRVS